jgi:hypothetical protein
MNTSNVVDAIRYWLRATLRPQQAIVELQDRPNKVAVAFWVNLIFAVLYAITALIYYAIGRLPAVEPWVPIAEDRYYLYQVFWTVPWGLVTWIAFSGIAHLLAIVGRKPASHATFEEALVVCGLAWVVPNAILMWIPETILVPLFSVFWPMWVETLRLMVIPPLWQSLFVAVGLRETHEVGWLRGIGIGAVTVAVFFVSFLAYMR